ncbi:oxidoreductase [Achromobacter xylosoxidans]|uniref:oxidoreductase n=1 Tax=Alcaligenes xylosoxydans xylosoxydans TaxID=85698 RepID=UPI00292F733B|nr:oxidoreductase [Achromobacter xylosoxidans]WOB74640.1 oxidoreductase [Achromobacter xylosoxidans]
MPVFELNGNAIQALEEVTFAGLGLREGAVQRFLREKVEVISPDTLVIAEEFGDWEDSARRIDLLGIHKTGDLVVIELKRVDAGHMELQALRYAAMVSTMTRSQAVETYRSYLEDQGRASDQAEQTVINFLHPDAKFGESVRIVLAATTFHKEITSTVLWLNDAGLDISCVRLTPYRNDDKILLDVDRFIPLPGAEDYTVALRNKVTADKREQKERIGRNLAKYTLVTPSGGLGSLSKRDLIYNVVKIALEAHVDVAQIQGAIHWKPALLLGAPGSMTVEDAARQLAPQAEAAGLTPDRDYFKDQRRLLQHEGMTYLLRRKWGHRTEEAVRNVIALLPPSIKVTFSIESRDD